MVISFDAFEVNTNYKTGKIMKDSTDRHRHRKIQQVPSMTGPSFD